MKSVLEEGRDLSQVKNDIKMSFVKPLHIRWLVETFDKRKLALSQCHNDKEKKSTVVSTYTLVLLSILNRAGNNKTESIESL